MARKSCKHWPRQVVEERRRHLSRRLLETRPNFPPVHSTDDLEPTRWRRHHGQRFTSAEEAAKYERLEQQRIRAMQLREAEFRRPTSAA